MLSARASAARSMSVKECRVAPGGQHSQPLVDSPPSSASATCMSRQYAQPLICEVRTFSNSMSFRIQPGFNGRFPHLEPQAVEGAPRGGWCLSRKMCSVVLTAYSLGE